MLVLKCSFEARSTGDGGVADWHSLDLEFEGMENAPRGLEVTLKPRKRRPEILRSLSYEYGYDVERSVSSVSRSREL